MRRTTTRRLRTIDPLIWVALGLMLLYVLVVALRPVGTFWSLDEGGKFLYLQNTVMTGNPAAPLAYPGQSIDRDLKFIPLYWYVQDGARIYSWWPVGFALLTMPIYRLLGWAGLYVLPVLAGVLTAIGAGLLARELLPRSQRAAAWTALIVGLATPVAFYSTMFWEHTPATACATLAVLMTLWAWRRGNGWLLLAAGVLAAAATFLRTENLSIAGGIGVALLLRRWRWSLPFGLSYAAACAPWLLWNRSLMGSFLGRQWAEGPNSVNAPLFVGLKQAGAWLPAHILFNSPKIIAFAIPPVLLAAATILAVIALAAPWFKRGRPLALVATLLIAALCAGVLLAPEGYRSVHGFVLIAPQVLLAAWLFGAPEGRRGIFPVVLLASIVIFSAAMVTRGWDAAGGQQWGPRYLLSLYPLLVVAAVVGFLQLRPALARNLVAPYAFTFLLTVLVAMGYEVRGWQASYQTTHHYGQTAAALRPLVTKPIATNCTWLTMILPEFYWSGLIFDVQNADELRAWQAYAAQSGATSGYQIEMDYCSFRTLDQIAALRVANPDGLIVNPLALSPEPVALMTAGASR